MKNAIVKRIILVALAAPLCAAARAQEIVAVLGADQRAYRETYGSFQAYYGKDVPVLTIGTAIPEGAKVVVTFGSKSAVQRYPGRLTVISGIAPGLTVDRKTRAGKSIKIMMEPEPEMLLKRLSVIQPKLRRLAVLWVGSSNVASSRRLVKAGEKLGIAVVAERMESSDDLPDRLRDLKGAVDAIWLLPDPLLINARNFEILKHFSYDNDVPFYVPTDGLAEQGATAAISVSYEEMGRTMARVVKAVLTGADVAVEAHSEKIQVSINRSAVAAAKLDVPLEALKSADKVYP